MAVVCQLPTLLLHDRSTQRIVQRALNCVHFGSDAIGPNKADLRRPTGHVRFVLSGAGTRISFIYYYMGARVAVPAASFPTSPQDASEFYNKVKLYSSHGGGRRADRSGVYCAGCLGCM